MSKRDKRKQKLLEMKEKRQKRKEIEKNTSNSSEQIMSFTHNEILMLLKTKKDEKSVKINSADYMLVKGNEKEKEKLIDEKKKERLIDEKKKDSEIFEVSEYRQRVNDFKKSLIDTPDKRKKYIEKAISKKLGEYDKRSYFPTSKQEQYEDLIVAKENDEKREKMYQKVVCRKLEENNQR